MTIILDAEKALDKFQHHVSTFEKSKLGGEEMHLDTVKMYIIKSGQTIN